jgi:hypothetical protein
MNRILRFIVLVVGLMSALAGCKQTCTRGDCGSVFHDARGKWKIVSLVVNGKDSTSALRSCISLRDTIDFDIDFDGEGCRKCTGTWESVTNNRDSLGYINGSYFGTSSFQMYAECSPAFQGRAFFERIPLDGSGYRSVQVSTFRLQNNTFVLNFLIESEIYSLTLNRL